MRFNHRTAAAAFRAVAGAFSEPIRIEPKAASEYSMAADDPARAPVDTRATVALSPAIESFNEQRQGGKASTSARFAVREARMWFPPDTYAAIGYPLRPGDRIVFTDRPDEPAYSVARDPVSSDRGDVTVYLVEGRYE